jgi:ribosomal protein L37AE/L43A
MSDATMPSPEVERRQEIVREFQRRRTREMLAGVPFIAAFVVIYQLRANPEYEIAGLSGPPLLMAAIAVIAGVLLHHAVNWRCPACGRNFWRGINVPLCRHCGAVFVGSRKRERMDPAGYQGQAERALQSDIQIYRARHAKRAFGALLLFGAGALIIFVALSGDLAANHQSQLYQTFGEQGVTPAGVALGGFFCLCGIAWMAVIVRRLTTGQRRYEERMRKMLKI